jgi:hypothetical protein
MLFHWRKISRNTLHSRLGVVQSWGERDEEGRDLARPGIKTRSSNQHPVFLHIGYSSLSRNKYINKYINYLLNYFIHSVVFLTKVLWPLLERVLHRVRASASSINFQNSLLFLRSSISCLRLLSRIPVTSIIHSNFPSVTCFRKKFLSKVWPKQSAFLSFIIN